MTPGGPALLPVELVFAWLGVAPPNDAVALTIAFAASMALLAALAALMRLGRTTMLFCAVVALTLASFLAHATLRMIQA